MNEEKCSSHINHSNRKLIRGQDKNEYNIVLLMFHEVYKGLFQMEVETSFLIS